MKQSVVLVTGATSGIGRHAALALARSGHRVIAAGRREAALASLVEEAKNIPGARLEPLVLDVTSAASIDAARDEIDRRTAGHGVDVLVNNAGIPVFGPIELVSDGDLRRQFDTNVFGLMAVTRAFVPRMRDRRRGRIVNVGSMGGKVTFPLGGAYHASKYAVEALSDALRMELAPFGVQVALIEPGPIKTEFFERTMDSVAQIGQGSCYDPVLARADVIRDQTEKTAVGPEPVVRAIVHAVEARRARARYVAPFRIHFILALFALLPTRITDALLGAALGLSRAADGAPRAQTSGGAA